MTSKATKKRSNGSTKAKKNQSNMYTYRPGTDGVDDTWDIYDPYGKFVLSVRYWDEPDTDEAAVTEARTKLIVDTLNLGYWW